MSQWVIECRCIKFLVYHCRSCCHQSIFKSLSIFVMFPGIDEEMVFALHKMFILVYLPESKTVSMSILSQINSLSVRASSCQHHGESTQVIVSQRPLMCVSYCTCVRCIYMSVRQYKTCLPIVFLRLSVYVCVGVHTCVHV